MKKILIILKNLENPVRCLVTKSIDGCRFVRRALFQRRRWERWVVRRIGKVLRLETETETPLINLP